MTTDIDLELKRAFDRRLSAFRAPPRRPRQRSWRLAIAMAVATAAFAAAGLIADVNSTAAANGVDCGNLMAKVQFWTSAKAVKAGKGPDSAQIAKWVQEYGCTGVAPAPLEPGTGKAGAAKK